MSRTGGGSAGPEVWALRKTHLAPLLLLALLGSACSGGAPEDGSSSASAPVGSDRLIVFLQDLSSPAMRSAVLPSYEGLQLAFASAVDRGVLPPDVRVESEDTKGDPATALALARGYVADPAVVAIVAAPFWREPVAVADAFAVAGVATLSLSPYGRPSTKDGPWRRMVATGGQQAETLASEIEASRRPAGRVCLVGDGSQYSSDLSAALAPLLHGTIALRSTLAPDDTVATTRLVAAVRSAGCGVLAWTGFGEEAAALRQSLSAAGLSDVAMKGADAMQGSDYPAKAGPAGDGTVATCPCVDLSTATGLAQQRFVHDFQSENQHGPGPYSAEAFDAGELLVRILGTARTRAGVATAIAATRSYKGLANTYTFLPTGELGPEAAHVWLYRTQDARWLPVVRSRA